MKKKVIEKDKVSNIFGVDEKSLKSGDVKSIRFGVLMLNQELNKRLEDIRKLNIDIKEAHKIFIEREKEVFALQKECRDLERNMKVLKQESADKSKEIKSLEHDLDLAYKELQLEKKNTFKEVERLTRGIKSKETELGESKQAIAHHKKRAGSLKERSESKGFDLAKMQHRIEDLCDKNSSMKTLVGNKEEQINMLKETVINKNKIISQLNKEMDSIKERI